MPPQLVHYIVIYGYPAIFALIFLQEIGFPIPVPNELVMLFSGYLAFKGTLLFHYLLLIIITADFSGTLCLYFLFYWAGNYMMAHRPRWIPLSDAKVNRLKGKISNGGLGMIFICRLTPFIRGYTSVISGLLHVKPKLFLPLGLLSSIIVCAVYTILGKAFGSSWDVIAHNWSVGKYYIAGLVLLVLLGFITGKLRAHRRYKQKCAERDQYIADQQITVHMISETAYITQGQGVHTAFLELLQLLKSSPAIRVVVNNEGTGNIFHAHTYGPYYFWKGRKYKGRRVLTAHVIPDSSRGTIPFWKQLLPLTKMYLKSTYAFADVIIAISPTVEKEIKALGVKSRVVRIYNPVLTENWARTPLNRNMGRQILGIKDHEKMVLGVGQLQERKGVEDFIDIADSMPDVRFVWVGGRPWGMFTEGIARINERIKNAPPNILFTGLKPVEDMAPMYAAADVFLFPSYQENCPLAPLEAAAAGLPVVFRDIPEYTSLYTHPYLKASDTTGFIKIAQQLLANNLFYKEGVDLSVNLIQEFNKERIKASIIDLYHQTLRSYYKI